MHKVWPAVLDSGGVKYFWFLRCEAVFIIKEDLTLVADFVIFEPHDGTFLGGACLILVKSLDFVLIRKVKVVLQCFGRRDS